MGYIILPNTLTRSVEKCLPLFNLARGVSVCKAGAAQKCPGACLAESFLIVYKHPLCASVRRCLFLLGVCWNLRRMCLARNFALCNGGLNKNPAYSALT